MRAFFLYSAIAVVAVSGLARASDGRLEINQTCVATGCFPGDTPGFPVQISAGGSFLLTSNLVVPDGNTTAISGTNNLRIDLNGFEISGITTCTGTPVTSCTNTGTGAGILGGDNTMIRNGAIRRMGSYGIRAGDGTLIEDMVVEQNGATGIDAGYGGAGWVVRDTRILRNGGDGFSTFYNYAEPEGGCVITGNTIYGNEENGIASGVGVASNNAISFNGGYALYLAAHLAITGNQFYENNGGNANPQLNGGEQIGGNGCGSAATCP